ncbi:ZmpA/ZmpB/ZmpC family metallo-endopeptidase [Streptococcus sp. BJSWXB3CM3]|uniref:ZmpA/ZmpB/ZmpC family metallo-endopeptidase n=1 Tax=Streptococcus sp. BJSWXB3CM3 TaxID=3095080 RepID=UPI002A8356B7|nr:ZmpA/ZmpB/ZmpC family metallo-endopeptidase [Streptococcus sp. BJSWXB3CM3]MDY4360533.1 ZmpA/ZmpB/ZmpC family metallo-endopeptidase [Streptococcus sp. BJSWXB3CM3]
MNTRKMQFERVIKYSIRKFSVGVGSAVIGTFLLGANNFLVETVSANEVATPNQVHYRYLAEQELTEAEKALIHHELPSDLKQDDVVYLVYRKKEMNSQQLPNTGSKELALATLGFATASMIVVVMSKKHRNKMLGLLFIGALGGSYFIPQSAQAFENKILVSYNQTIAASSQEDLAKGVIQIEGYEYVGYFKASDFQEQPEQMTTAKGTQEEGHEGESLVQPEAPAYTGEITAKGTQEEGHQGESLVQPELPAYTGEITAKGTQEEGHQGESLVQPEAPAYTGEINAKGTQEAGHEGESLVQPELPAYTGEISAKGTQEEGHEGESLVQPELPAYTGEISAKGTQEEGHEGESLVQPELPAYTGELTSKGTQEAGHQGESLIQPELPAYTGEISAKGTQESGHEGESLVQPESPAYTGEISAKGTQEESHEGESLVQPDSPAYTGEVTAKGTQEECHQGESLIQPELPADSGEISAKGTQDSGHEGESLFQPESPAYTGEISAKGTQEEGHEGESLVQPESPSYTGEISAKGTQEESHEGESLVQPESPSYTGEISAKGTQEESHEGESLVQPESPSYTGEISAKGTQEESHEGESLVQPESPAYTGEVTAKGTQEEGHQGESLVQPELPEYKVAEATITETETVEVPYTKEYVADDTRYTDEETVIQNGQAGSQLIHRVYKTVNGQKVGDPISTSTETVKAPVNEKISRGTKAIEGQVEEVSFEEIPFETRTEVDSTLPKGTEVVAQAGQNGKKKITKVYKTLKGVKTADAPTISEEVVEAVQDRIIKKGDQILTEPTLTLTQIDKEELERSAKVRYQLVKPTGVTIKSLEVVLKDGDTSLQTVNMSEGDLTANLTNLKYYKDYKIATKMVYDRGNGNEEVVLTEEPLRLDLKKVEVKNIKETSLISVDDQGVETDNSLLSAKPSDVKPYYLKVTTHDNKVTKLAVDKIEEVTVDGKALFKVTAKAPDLVQRNADNQFTEEYVHYFAKPKAHEGDVYYDFNDLVKAMQANPTGTFKLGSSMNASNVQPAGKSYVTNAFKGTLESTEGNKFAIHNITRPLFGNIEGGTVKNLLLENVNIDMPGFDRVAPIANVIKNNATVENVKVTGNVIGGNDVAGIINKIDGSGKVSNVAFIGKIHAAGNKGWYLAGVLGENWKGIVEKAYVDAEITGNKAKAAGLVYSSQNGGDNNTLGREGVLRNSVAKGSIELKEAVQSGGLLGTNWALGAIEDNITMMKVKTGEMVFGHSDIDADDYFTYSRTKRNFSVEGVSEGNKSYKNSRKIPSISQEEADKKIEAMGITADKFESTKPVEDKLNNIVNKADQYKTIDGYDASRELAYRNIEKLQPFYNKEWIVNQGNKLAAGSPLLTKEILSVTAMKGNAFVTELADADHIMVHYGDKTKDIFTVSPKDSKVKQVKEYSIAELGEVVYTPNMVDKDRSDLINAIVEKLSPVELQSDPIYTHLGRTGPNKVNAIKDLYLEESFKEVKDNLAKFVKQLLENEDHQLNTDEAAKRALIKKIDDNKAAVLLGLSYLNRYYGVKFDNFNIKQLMLFKPDFYGKNVNVLDFLIKIGSKENNIKGDRTLEAYRETIGGVIGIGELNSFLDYNMRLFTEDKDLNDWFIKSTKDNVYIVEPKTTTPEFADKKHRAYEGLNNDMHGKMILPLLNLKDAHMFLISTYNTMAYSSFEKYGKYTEAERNAFKAEIDKVAKGQQNYLDFWSRLATDKVRNQLLKSNNMVPTPVLDNQNYKDISTDKYGHTNSGKDVAPIRELYGPTGRYHATDWRMGAVARVYANPYKDDSVFFMVTDMISDFGVSAFTHETTHVNDRMVYLGGSRHREGTDLEAFAQGMLQTPSVSNPNGEYKALGLNMAYERPNDGNQWYNTNPNDLKSRDEIDRYMKGYNDTLMLLDYLEGEAVLDKANQDLNNAWFKKVDKQYRGNNTKNQFDKVRPLSDEEKAIPLRTVDDLVTNNFMTNRGPGNRVYNPTDFDSAYVNVPMMSGIYGGNTSEGAPGAMSFKHNTFRIWGYYGYEKGFLNYASNMLKAESKKAGKDTLGDDFIINKISEGKFNNLEDWKKAYFKEVVTSAKNGIQSIEIDGKTYNSYEDLKRAFAEAVDKDKATLSKGSVKFDNTVALKEKLFKKLLQQTDSFKTSIFK